MKENSSIYIYMCVCERENMYLKYYMQVNIAKNAQTEQKQKSIKNESSFSHIPIQNNLEDPISSDFDIKESIHVCS